MGFNRHRFGGSSGEIVGSAGADCKIKKALDFFQRLKLFHLVFLTTQLAATEENSQERAAAKQGSHAGLRNRLD